MDEQAFQQARLSRDWLPCVFEKSILAGGAPCALSNRWANIVAEIVACLPRRRAAPQFSNSGMSLKEPEFRQLGRMD